MTPPNEQTLIEKLRRLPPQRQAEVEDFVEFLATKERTRALDRLLSIAPALEAAGAEPMSEEEVVAEVKAARAERRAKLATSTQKDPNADRA
jgi:Protein of unknown function (DUF2281)